MSSGLMNGEIAGGGKYAPQGEQFKRLVNMHFNQHGGRKGVRSASAWSERSIRQQAKIHGSIRPGPAGSGLISPGKPTALESGHEGRQSFSHLHQLHESYNEK